MVKSQTASGGAKRGSEKLVAIERFCDFLRQKFFLRSLTLKRQVAAQNTVRKIGQNACTDNCSIKLADKIGNI